MITEREIYARIKPLLESTTEGINWDFKKSLNKDHIPDIIKDVLAFSNSNYKGDSYIIVGVSEPQQNTKSTTTRIALSTDDRRRLNTDANYIYTPDNWDVHGLSAGDIENMKQFSAALTEQIACNMLISQPQCEFIPVRLGTTRWLYVIIIKKVPGVFVSKKDILSGKDNKKVAVKQGVLYIRIADTTLGGRTDVASAAEHIRIWKQYIDWLEMHDNANKLS